MSLCSTPLISTINPNECIGSSLGKINSNFYKLQESICDLSANTINEIDSQEIDIFWDPTTRILSATLQPGAEIANSKLAKMSPYTVKGNPTPGTINPVDIYAPECTVLGRYDSSFTTLSFAQLVNCQITNRTIETGKIKQNTLLNDVFADDVVNNRVLSAMPPYSVKGNATGNIGVDPQDIEAGPYTVLARPSGGNLEWSFADTNTALIRTSSNPIKFVQAPVDSVLMRDQTTLRFVAATDWSAYVKPNNLDPLKFTPAASDSALFRSGAGSVQFNAANQNSLLLRDNTNLRFVDTPINTVIARDEGVLRPLSAEPYSAFIRPGLSDTAPDDRLQFRVAQPNTALIRTSTLNLSFAQSPEDSVLMRDQTTLRFVTAPGWSAYVKPNNADPLKFTPASTNSALLRDNSDVRFVAASLNTVIARDEFTLRPISAEPYSAFIRPGPSDTAFDDRLQFRVAEPNTALIRTNTQNLSFAFAPENSALLRMKGDHLRHVVAPSNTALIMTKGKNSGSTGVESLSFTPAPRGTILRRKHANITDESHGGLPGSGNEALDFGKISYDMFDWNSGSIGVGTVCMFYPTVVGTTVANYFDAGGLGIADTVYEGWAICNGNSYTFSIKVEDGTTKVKTFVTPDMRCRFPVSTEWNGTTAPVQTINHYKVGVTGGEEQHTLTVSELANHSHNVDDKGHKHKLPRPQLPGSSFPATGGITGDLSKPLRNQSTEKEETNIKVTGIKTSGLTNQPHENRPQYYSLFFIIKLYSGKINNSSEITAGAVSPPPPPSPTPTPTPTPTPIVIPAGYSLLATDLQIGSPTDFIMNTSGGSVGFFIDPSNNLYNNNSISVVDISISTGSSVEATSLDLTSFTNVTDVNVSGSTFTNINIAGCAQIRQLNISGTDASTLTLGTHTLMTTLDCSNTLIPSLNVSSLNALQYLDCSGNAALANLTLNNNISSINVSGCSSLNSVNVPSRTFLKYLYITDVTNSAFAVDVTGTSSLEELVISNCPNNTFTFDNNSFKKIKTLVTEFTPLNQSTVQSILSNINANNTATGVRVCQFDSNTVYTAAALTSKASLMANGWTITP